MSEPKITYGICKAHYAIKTASRGVVSYAPPVALPGAYEITMPPVGDPVKVFGDNGIYYRQNVNQGYDGTLSVYTLPEIFQREVLGLEKDNNGVLVEIAGAVQREAALLFEFNTDGIDTKRSVLYSCSFGRSDVTGKTKTETIEPQGFTIPITGAALEDSGLIRASLTGNKSNPAWASWFSSVYAPVLADKLPVTVTVSDSGGPLADVLVACGTMMAMTDEDGVAAFALPAGSYDLFTSKAGYAPKTDSVTVASTAVSKSVTLVAR